MDNLRDFLKSWPGRILLILCLSPLALLGIESYFHSGVDPNQVAQVGDESVSLSQYQNALNSRRSELLEDIEDPSLLNEDVLHQQVLHLQVQVMHLLLQLQLLQVLHLLLLATTHLMTVT